MPCDHHGINLRSRTRLRFSYGVAGNFPVIKRGKITKGLLCGLSKTCWFLFAELQTLTTRPLLLLRGRSESRSNHPYPSAPNRDTQNSPRISVTRRRVGR